MKECPNCKKIFADDLFYCLFDGNPLTNFAGGVDRSVATEAAFDLSQSAPTEILPNLNRSVLTQVSPKRETTPSEPPSKLPYLAIAALTLACISLAAAMVVLNRDRLFSAQDTKVKIGDEVRSTPASLPVSNSGQSANTVKVANQTTRPPTADLDPAGKWRGGWSADSGALLDFDLTLTDTGNNGVEGQIKWTLRKTLRPDKMDKVGLSATEYVRGTFDPATGSVKMSGYGKDDPNNVLVMVDDYRLNISPDGHTLSGVARNGGKWNGRIKLTR